MKRVNFFVILSTLFLFSSCEVIEGIFKAGFYSAVFIGIILIVLVIWLVNRFKKP